MQPCMVSWAILVVFLGQEKTPNFPSKIMLKLKVIVIFQASLECDHVNYIIALHFEESQPRCGKTIIFRKIIFLILDDENTFHIFML